MREELVKKRIKKILERYSVKYWMPPANRYGVSGFPDFVAPLKVYWGEHALYLTIEAKGQGGQLRSSQEDWRDDIREVKGLWFLIDHRNFGDLHLTLWLLGARHPPQIPRAKIPRSKLPPKKKSR